MRMNRIIRIITMLSAGVLLCSCMKSKLETTYNNQESRIDQYLSRYEETNRIVRNGGANRLILTEGQGDSLKRNGNVSFYYAGYTFNGSVNASGLFATNHQATAEQAGWELTEADFQLYEINLNEARLVQGLKDGLYGVKAGEECEIVFSGKYGFGNENFGIIPANSALLYKIWVVGVSND